ncbi:MAG TPA: sigma-70 family RNA polymerase sigma factor [Acidobacteriota bacterium]|nr:sigma-70 family RNA polymerase sigma factor [Acidobacteriota bacterium]
MQFGVIDGWNLGEAVATVLQRHNARWFRFVLRVLGNEADAEDALQEAVRRVLVRNRLFTTEEQVKKYLGRAITNTAIELYYSRKRDRKRHVNLQEDIRPCIQAMTPLTILEENEKSAEEDSLLQALTKALGRLPPKQFQAVRLTMLEPGISSIRDAGELNGIAYSTLRHRSVQGIVRLRKFIRQTMRSAGLRNRGRENA